MRDLVRMGAAVLLLGGLPGFSAGPEYRIQTVAGSDQVGDGGPAAAALLSSAEGVAVDAAGNLYIADTGDHRVRKVSPNGIITTVAGNGHAGYKGDGGPGSEAMLNQPYGVAVDAAGNVYIADFGNGRVRQVTADGIIRTVAGGGQNGTQAGEATAAHLVGPRNVAVDAGGNLYISDFLDHRVYRVSRSGRIQTLAGTGARGLSGNDGPAAYAQLSFPAGLAFDRNGVLFIADSGNRRVRKVEGGTIRELVISEPLEQPTGLAFDREGNLYVADRRRIVKVQPDGTAEPQPVPARDAAVDGSGNLILASGSAQVSRFSEAAGLRVVAGSGAEFRFQGDGGPATAARLNTPRGLALDGAGNLFIADSGNGRVRKVTASGEILTVAGAGNFGMFAEGVPATSGLLVTPVDLAYDASGNLWIADSQAARVRQVTSEGTIHTAAGTGLPGFNGAGGPATSTHLSLPGGVAVDGAGNLYIADTNNHRIRKVTPTGVMSTIAGSGVRGYGGDGGPATSAMLDSPEGVAVDRDGNLYIADRRNHAIRKVSEQGVISTVAGTGIQGFAGDGGPATRAQLKFPSAVAVDETGNLYIADTQNNRIRKVTSSGVIRTIAGDGMQSFGGDGGPALTAQLALPAGIAVDAAGNVYVADSDNHRVRKLTPPAEPEMPPPVADVEVVNAASLRSGPVAPGELVSILAPGIGPPTPAQARPDGSGYLPRILNGTQVLFDGAPAPLIYAGPDQINAQVPYGVAGRKETELEIVSQGAPRFKTSLPVAEAAPAIFTVEGGSGQAAALNEDGSFNSEWNAAPRGSVVTLFATGAGQTTPPGEDGKAAAAPFATPSAPLALSIGGFPAEILFAGSAPALVGVLQINARVPSGFAPRGILPVELTVRNARSQPGVTLAVR